MSHLAPLIADLALILICAGIMTLLFKKLKQPLVLGYVVAGFLASPHMAYTPSVMDTANIQTWADIGVIFLLFALGLEFSFKKIVKVGGAAIIAACTIIFCMILLGVAVGTAFGWKRMDCIFLGGMIAMSSTTIIYKAFDDLGMRKKMFTGLVLSVLILEDILAIVLMVMLSTMAVSHNFEGTEMLGSIAKLLFFLILWFVVGIYLIPVLLKKCRKLMSEETLLIVSLGLCFGMVVLAAHTGFSAAFGAFIMGSILAESSLIHRIERNIQPIKDFFGAVFFVSVGMMVDPSMFVEFAWPIFLITLIVIAGKVAFSCLGFIISGQPVKTAILCGFSLAQVGEFAFIIASLGLSLKVLDARVYPIIVAVSVITTFLTPMMIKAAGPFYQFVLRAAPKSWQAYISRTEKEVKVSPSEERLWTELFKNYLLRMILFSMILYTIILLSGHYLQPLVAGVLPGIGGRVVMTAVTLIAMAPFLKALIGWEAILPAFLRDTAVKVLCKIRKPRAESVTENSWVKKVGEKFDFCGNWGENAENVKNFFISNSILAKIYYKLWISKKTNRLPLVLMTSFRLLVVAFFIVMVVHKFLTEDAKVSLLLLLISVIVLAQSKWLLTQYMKIEAQFLANLRGHHGEKAEPSEKADD